MALFYDISKYSPSIDGKDEIITIPTDSKEVNNILCGGISTSEFILIQAPSGAGKTTVLERLALRACFSKEYDGEVAFISLGEQQAKIIMEQILCMNASIDYRHEYKRASTERREELYEGMKKYQKCFENKLKIYYTRQPFDKYYYNRITNEKRNSIDDVPFEFKSDYYQINDFELIMNDIVKRDIKFVFIDYVGAENADPLITSRYESLKTLCDTLAYTAEKNNICIVGGIQTNKNFLAYYSSKEFDPRCVNELYTADSVNTMRKATIGISFIRCDRDECSYVNIFKGRYVDTGCVKIKVQPRTFRWLDESDEMGFKY